MRSSAAPRKVRHTSPDSLIERVVMVGILIGDEQTAALQRTCLQKCVSSVYHGWPNCATGPIDSMDHRAVHRRRQQQQQWVYIENATFMSSHSPRVRLYWLLHGRGRTNAMQKRARLSTGLDQE